MGKNNGGTTGKGFRAGKSGNPAGRPKKREELQAKCTRVVDDVVVDAWIQEVQLRGDDWVECSKLLAAYGYGKPTQKIEHSGALTLEQLITNSLQPTTKEQSNG